MQADWDRAKFLTNTKTGRNRDLGSVVVWYHRPGLRWAAAAAIVFCFLAAGLTLTRFPGSPAGAPTIAYATQTGEIRTVLLTDGSSVTLDAASRMQVSIDAGKREVRLVDGSARFDVKHDPGRQFDVVTTGGTVTTDGGRFDVTDTTALVRVTAFTGRLAFKRSGSPTMPSSPAFAINPGQRLSLASLRQPEMMKAPESGQQDWTTGMLSFDGDRLSDAVAEFNRHNGRQIALTDPAIADLRITGAFHANDADGFARAIAAMLGLRRQDRSGVIELSSKK